MCMHTYTLLSSILEVLEPDFSTGSKGEGQGGPQMGYRET